MTMWRVLLFALFVLPVQVARAQYVATPQAGVSYPSLTNPSPVVMTAPGSNDPKDRGRATIPIGFNFSLYNRVYTQLTITANGVMFLEPSSAANTSSDFPGNVALPSGAEPNGLIAPFWDDLIGNNPTSVLQTQSVTGANGQGLAIEFKDWNRVFGTFTLTFQVRLWANGIVEFFYGPMIGSGATTITATIGIESGTGTASTRGLTNCTFDCAINSFDPAMTGTPISYIKFGPPAGVDLQALGVRVDSISGNPDAGILTIASTLNARNFGTLPSGAWTYQLYLSQDTIVDVGDFAFTPQPASLASIASLGSTAASATGDVTFPDSGSWYVLAAIDPLPDGGDINLANNVVASTVPYAAGIDLIAEAVNPPPVAGPGDPVSVPVQFSNQGFEPAGAVSVKLFASVDTIFSVDDRQLADQSLTILGGQQVQQPLSFVIPNTTMAGDYFVLLVLDNGPTGGAITERSELNNVVVSSSIMQIRQADLVVTAVRVERATAPFDEITTAFFGEPARFEAFVSNAGGAIANNVSITIYMSDNESLNAVTDKAVGTVSMLTFAPGDSRWVTLPSAVVPTNDAQGRPFPVQPYFFFAAATAGATAEANSQNNFDKSAPVVVRNAAPDLLAVELQTPLRAGAGELIAVSRTLTNLGNRDAPTTPYRFVLSANPIITADDLPLMRVTSSGEVLEGTVTLQVGQRDSAVELLRMPSTVASATWYVGVLLDPDDSLVESDETNNGLAGSRTDVVSQSLHISTPLLPDANVGLPYFARLEAAGAPGPFTWVLADPASMPPGLMLSMDGVITGTPTQRGAWTPAIEVRAGTRSVIGTVPLRVAPVTSSLALNATPLPAPTRAVAYRAELGATGGAGGYQYNVTSGILPTGLTLASNGLITGTPSDALGTTRTFTVRVVDLIGNVDERAYSMTVVDAAPFTIQTRTLRDGVIGADYLEQIFAANPGGAPVSLPVRWAKIVGELPPGVALEASTGDTLVISGVPTVPGFYEFTIEAVDGQGRTDAYSYFVTISAGEVVARVTGPSLVLPGDDVAVTFSAAPLPANSQWFWQGGRLPAGLEFHPDGTITGTIAEDAPLGVYSFTAGVGLRPNNLFSIASWSIEVANQRVTKQTCSSVDGSLLLWLGGLLALRRRRR
ncbi:MAG: putative Ig domain-containing protein [Archangium sp.]